MQEIYQLYITSHTTYVRICIHEASRHIMYTRMYVYERSSTNRINQKNQEKSSTSSTESMVG